MKAVIQEDRTGCAIACVAALARQTYPNVKDAATKLGIDVRDSRLWTSTRHMRTLLKRFGFVAGRVEEPFVSWDELPNRALLAIKWKRDAIGGAWHWVVFIREKTGPVVLDSKRGLRNNRRSDFGRMKPRWFIRLAEDCT